PAAHASVAARRTDHSDDGLLLLRWIRGLVRGSLAGAPFVSPLRRLDRFAPAVVKLYQPLDGLAQARLGGARGLGLSLSPPLVSWQQQGLGLGVSLLARQAAAQHRPSVEGCPRLRLRPFAERQAVAQQRLGVGEPLLSKQVEAQKRQGTRHQRVGRPELLP